MRSLEDEAAALRSALGARGVRLADVVTFTRTFNGFAATVAHERPRRLPSLGVRAQPVRRFYPASREPARVPRPAAPAPRRRSAARRSPCSTRASTSTIRCSPAGSTPATTRSNATTTRARTPRGGRRETSGTALAGVLVAAGERVMPIRSPARSPRPGRGPEDVAITDQLLAGLERAVDPDGDGATDDHARSR